MSAIGPMRMAKMEAFARWVGDDRKVLDARAYRSLADAGLNRSDVARAADDLFECGRAGVDGSDGRVAIVLMDSPT